MPDRVLEYPARPNPGHELCVVPKLPRYLLKIRLSHLTHDPSLKALFASIERDDPMASAENVPAPRQPSPLAARELVEASHLSLRSGQRVLPEPYPKTRLPLNPLIKCQNLALT